MTERKANVAVGGQKKNARKKKKMTERKANVAVGGGNELGSSLRPHTLVAIYIRYDRKKGQRCGGRWE